MLDLYCDKCNNNIKEWPIILGYKIKTFKNALKLSNTSYPFRINITTVKGYKII
jgi:hypothetical protein